MSENGNEALSVVELRKLCGERGIGASGWRATARRDDLLRALDSGVAPELPLPRPAVAGDAASVLAALINPHLQPVSAGVDEATVRAIVKAELAAMPAPRVEVSVAGGPVVSVERQHYLFPLLLAIAGARLHAYLVGPAGSGKTHAAHAAARALGLGYSAISVCRQTSVVALLGYMDAVGKYVGTEFRRRYEGGGVFLLDEADAGNANVLAVLNASLANDSMAFPDGMVTRHKDFVLVAAANTYGTGADRVYIGREQLDGATLDRFCFVAWPYDAGLEAHTVGVVEGSPACDVSEGGVPTAAEWLARVRGVRAAAEAHKLRVVISPRASQYGARLASAGVGKAWLERMLLRKGMDAATWAKAGGAE